MTKEEWAIYKAWAERYIMAALNYFKWLPAIEVMMDRED